MLEYPVRGGRLDVVWTWASPSPIPQFDRPVPVVGFEIESSWRTRKHVKGDLLNLQDAGVALGVIVLAGAGPKDDSLREFAAVLVDRPGPSVLVWAADDVRALAAGGGAHAAATLNLGAVAPTDEPGPDDGGAYREPASTHSGKYAPLFRWLSRQEADSLTTTFAEVEEVLGFPLPSSCRQHVQHWHGYSGSAVARAIADAGWKASHVRLAEEELTLLRAT